MLKLSLNVERSFTPYTLETEKMEVDFISINGNVLLLSFLFECKFCKSESRPVHILIQQGKNDD